MSTFSPVETPYLSALEKGIIDEVNRARTNPSAYAAYLEGIRNSLSTIEGPSVITETIQFLRSQAPLAPLELSQGMTMAARDQVNDTGPQGLTGHQGTDGSTMSDRLERYGTWQTAAAENISYGKKTARDVVLQLLIDDNVSSRGHRTNIFNPQHRFIGIDSGPHRQWGTMAVMTLAGNYTSASSLPTLPSAVPDAQMAFNPSRGTPEIATPSGVTDFTNLGEFFTLSDNSDRINLADWPDAMGKSVLALNGNDTVFGTTGNDEINGNRGNDDIRGGSDNDYIRGGKDFDVIWGEDGNDILNGNNNDDTVYGGAGDDIVRGGKNNDILFGESGNDFLVGDFGQDSLIGGLGSDIFVLRSDSQDGFKNTSSFVTEVDIIADFNPNEGDRIGLNNGLSFSNLTFEELDIAVNGASQQAIALRIGATGDYLGLVLNVGSSALQVPDNFVTADQRLMLG
ncbi:hypothetical protein J0895_02930 [Phormidium pseudopriestleyi FRX01]|uniref:SCP domain-containing protein n=1 Tax=Phormidium pseudopriestleyi FRX01 TaxID=1759528 RepID=A0ABS3FN45_9CYAN|nr:CAP domain-containing protein [Phormidium pseudopriestleyi]MBO0348071.1 hypothetical protein [Phormidium pseudopriestleyi FRX01]